MNELSESEELLELGGQCLYSAHFLDKCADYLINFLHTCIFQCGLVSECPFSVLGLALWTDDSNNC